MQSMKNMGNNKIIYSVYLIGDAGMHPEPGPALILLQKELLANPQSAVVFLGDNIYPTGLIVKKRPTKKSNCKNHG